MRLVDVVGIARERVAEELEVVGREHAVLPVVFP